MYVSIHFTKFLLYVIILTCNPSQILQWKRMLTPKQVGLLLLLTLHSISVGDCSLMVAKVLDILLPTI